MARDPDEDRIRKKAHELWVAEGHPHGRDEDHWVQAREIIAIEDSQGDTLLPRDFGADTPIEEPQEALRNLADFPNLTDQGENLLTSTDREPSYGSDGDGPSIEVPTSDQPGIPSKKMKPAAQKSVSKPAAAAAVPPSKPKAPASKPPVAGKKR